MEPQGQVHNSTDMDRRQVCGALDRNACARGALRRLVAAKPVRRSNSVQDRFTCEELTVQRDGFRIPACSWPARAAGGLRHGSRAGWRSRRPRTTTSGSQSPSERWKSQPMPSVRIPHMRRYYLGRDWSGLFLTRIGRASRGRPYERELAAYRG